MLRSILVLATAAALVVAAPADAKRPTKPDPAPPAPTFTSASAPDFSACDATAPADLAAAADPAMADVRLWFDNGDAVDRTARLSDLRWRGEGNATAPLKDWSTSIGPVMPDIATLLDANDIIATAKAGTVVVVELPDAATAATSMTAWALPVSGLTFTGSRGWSYEGPKLGKLRLEGVPVSGLGTRWGFRLPAAPEPILLAIRTGLAGHCLTATGSSFLRINLGGRSDFLDAASIDHCFGVLGPDRGQAAGQLIESVLVPTGPDIGSWWGEEQVLFVALPVAAGSETWDCFEDWDVRSYLDLPMAGRELRAFVSLPDGIPEANLGPSLLLGLRLPLDTVARLQACQAAIAAGTALADLPDCTARADARSIVLDYATADPISLPVGDGSGALLTRWDDPALIDAIRQRITVKTPG